MSWVRRRRSACASMLVAMVLIIGEAGFAAPAPSPERIDAAFSGLKSFGWEGSAEDLGAIDEAIAATTAGTSSRHELETKLAALLGGAAPVAAQQFAGGRLAVIGTPGVVAKLAPLLNHPQLSHAARLALENIPGDEASTALRGALPQADGARRIGIIHSLGIREDAAAVNALRRSLRNEELEVARAAALALGRIGTPEAAQALEEFARGANRDVQAAIAQGRLLAAERLLRNGRPDLAFVIFDELYNADDTYLRIAAWRGRLRSQPEKAAEAIHAALTGSDRMELNAAQQELLELPELASLQPFVKGLSVLPPAGQVVVLNAIATKAVPGGRAAALDACTSDDPQVRRAAFRALAAVGTADDALPLARLAANGGIDSSAARLALTLLRGPDVDRRLISALRTAPTPLRIELLAALSSRAAVAAVAAVIDLLQENDQVLSAAALSAIGALGSEEHLPAVLASFRNASGEATRKAGDRALGMIVLRTKPRCLPVLLSELAGAPVPLRVSLLQKLPAVGGPDALAAVRREREHADASVRAAAFAAMCAWPDDTALDDLLAVARDEGSDDRTEALRSYLRIATRTSAAADPAAQMARLQAAACIVCTAEETAMLVSSYGDVALPASLSRLATYLDDPAQSEIAGAAIVKVATVLGRTASGQSVPLLRRVMAVTREPNLMRQAGDLIDRLGASTN